MTLKPIAAKHNKLKKQKQAGRPSLKPKPKPEPKKKIIITYKTGDILFFKADDIRPNSHYHQYCCFKDCGKVGTWKHIKLGKFICEKHFMGNCKRVD